MERSDVDEFVARTVRDAPTPSPRVMRLLYDLLPPVDDGYVRDLVDAAPPLGDGQRRPR
jgi:hypothetical protein